MEAIVELGIATVTILSVQAVGYRPHPSSTNWTTHSMVIHETPFAIPRYLSAMGQVLERLNAQSVRLRFSSAVYLPVLHLTVSMTDLELGRNASSSLLMIVLETVTVSSFYAG